MLRLRAALLVAFISTPAGLVFASATTIDGLLAMLAAARTRGEAASIEQQIEAAEEKPVSPTARVLVDGGNAALVAGKPGKAVGDLDSAIDLQPDLAILWRERAVMRLHSGDNHGAIADLGEAINRAPRDFQAWTLLSEITESTGDASAAYAAWQKVLAIDPQAANAAKRLDLLKRKALGQPI